MAIDLDVVARLDEWLSEEGILTGARSVRHMEFDCNWREPYRVVLGEWDDEDGLIEFIGESRAGLAAAVDAALLNARDRNGKVAAR